jgi:Short C-terminal domain
VGEGLKGERGISVQFKREVRKSVTGGDVGQSAESTNVSPETSEPQDAAVSAPGTAVAPAGSDRGDWRRQRAESKAVEKHARPQLTRAEAKAVKTAARDERQAELRQRREAQEDARLRRLYADDGVYLLLADSIAFRSKRRPDKTYALSGSTAAQLEVSGQVVATSSRTTLTRVVTMGLFATQKKGKIVDTRHIFITVVDDRWSLLIKGTPTAEKNFREWMHRLEHGLRAFDQPDHPADQPDHPNHATSADAVMDQLERLAGLRDRGILTDAEFEVQKAKLLSV